jgi:murein DD-endopeptidase MepM/ murein hydrolase activator NlpD
MDQVRPEVKILYNGLVSTVFQERFVSLNNLAGKKFGEWLFYPAMLFGSREKWWGDMGLRDGPHEGLDICMYRTSVGDIRYLDAGTKVPLAFTGRIVRIIDDFLGKSVFVRHDETGSEGKWLYTVYGHIVPSDDVHPGVNLSGGDCIGTIAGSGNSGSTVRPHLHISVARIPDSLLISKLDWEIISGSDEITLIDPLDVVAIPYSVTTL